MNLTVNIQTRGRPQLLRSTVESICKTAERKDTKIFIAVDDDDKATIDSLADLPKDDRIIVSTRPREDSRGEKYDRALTEAPADVYMLHVDCAPVLTPGFDKAILQVAEIFPDKIGCVYTPMANRSFPGAQCITAKLVEQLGCMYSHEYPFWFIDHELDDICRMIGRYAFARVAIDHATMRPGKTHRMRDLVWWCNYFDASNYRRIIKAHEIIDKLDTPSWQKKMLKSQYPIVEQRSLMVNDSVRQSAFFIEASRGDGTQPFDMTEFQQMQAAGKAEIYLRSRFENRAPPDEGYVRMFSASQKRLREMQREVAAVMQQKAAA